MANERFPAAQVCVAIPRGGNANGAFFSNCEVEFGGRVEGHLDIYDKGVLVASAPTSLTLIIWSPPKPS